MKKMRESILANLFYFIGVFSMFISVGMESPEMIRADQYANLKWIAGLFLIGLVFLVLGFLIQRTLDRHQPEPIRRPPGSGCGCRF